MSIVTFGTLHSDVPQPQLEPPFFFWKEGLVQIEGRAENDETDKDNFEVIHGGGSIRISNVLICYKFSP